MYYLILLFYLVINNMSVANKTITDLRITCKDFKKLSAGLILYYTQSLSDNKTRIMIHLSNSDTETPIVIDPEDSSSIQNVFLDPSKKTYLIIHGYKANARSKWVVDLKRKLIKTYGSNVFVIDWSTGGNRFNYVNAARNTEHTSRQIFRFLQKLKSLYDYEKRSSNRWKELHFIGHSLGAHISGQIGYLLRNDDFWKVKRITGLDPAKPCFIDIDNHLRIDKDDADLVDIIHTQVYGSYALGMKERLGHVDIYVNGGSIQPECHNRFFSTPLTKMICSHRLSYAYLIESLDTSTCSFTCYPWNGTRTNAEDSLALFISGHNCAECPVMGLEVDDDGKHDMYIVFTSHEPPFCNFTLKGLKYLLRIMKNFKD